MDSTQPFADLKNFVAKFEPIFAAAKAGIQALEAVRDHEARGQSLAETILERERQLKIAEANLARHEAGIATRMEDAETRAKAQAIRLSQEIDALAQQRDAQLETIKKDLAVAVAHREEALQGYDKTIVERRETLKVLRDQIDQAQRKLAELRSLVKV